MFFIKLFFPYQYSLIIAVVDEEFTCC